MTPVSDIEKLEHLQGLIDKGAASFDDHAELTVLLEELSPSLIADWKAMRGEIERLTKELDGVLALSKATHLGIQDAVNDAYEQAARVCDDLSDLHANGEVWISACEMCADDIRALKAKEE